MIAPKKRDVKKWTPAYDRKGREVINDQWLYEWFAAGVAAHVAATGSLKAPKGEEVRHMNTS